jgi:predicted DNA-binding protein (UPF0251 family)
MRAKTYKGDEMRTRDMHLLTSREAAYILGISVKTLHRRAREKVIRPYTIPGSNGKRLLRFEESELATHIVPFDGSEL